MRINSVLKDTISKHLVKGGYETQNIAIAYLVAREYFQLLFRLVMTSQTYATIPNN